MYEAIQQFVGFVVVIVGGEGKEYAGQEADQPIDYQRFGSVVLGSSYLTPPALLGTRSAH